MMMYLFKKFQERKWEFIVLLFIIAIGIFLRTYNFHDWLHFGSDQARDALVAERVLDNTVSWPLLGADASNTRFKLGPIYYYFQIISAKIFGSDVAVLAFPDLLFSFLAIPFFYILLRRYFEKNLSLAMTGLYSVSFYIVEYSRFAWNPNPIPFFVMLFLSALMEFFILREKTGYIWIILLGAAFGVGIQLHTILLLLLPTIFFVSSVFLLKKDRGVWKKIIIVIAVALLLNLGQIKSEVETGGANSLLFLKAFTDRSQGGMNRFSENLRADVFYHMQANTHILSSLGDKGSFTFFSILSHPERTENRKLHLLYVGGVIIGILFFVFGYGLLAWRVWQENDREKKIFLGMILMYVVFSFLIIFPIARGVPLRYFIHTTFIPFILLGIMINWLRLRLPRQYTILVVFTFLFLFVANSYTIVTEASLLAKGERGDRGFVVLDQAEQMVDYMIARSAPEKEASLFGGTGYVSTYFKSLQYLAEKKNFKLNRVNMKKALLSDKPYFFIDKSLKAGESFYISRFDFIENKNFGRLGIYQLKKQ